MINRVPKSVLTVSLCTVILLLSIGCQTEQSESGASKDRRLPNNGIASRNREHGKADYRILFVGNSHTASHQIPKTVQAMLNARQSDKKVYCEICVGTFLAAQLSEGNTPQRIRELKWDVVVLQAQKYSSTGKYTYPTDAAEELTRIANEQGAKVIMYPEWRRRQSKNETNPGKIGETMRIHQLHESIAAKTGAVVAPVGLAWKAALEQYFDWNFYSDDGNHCNARGAFLTAAVFESILSQHFLALSESAKSKRFDPDKNYGIDTQQQPQLVKIATKAVKQQWARESAQVEAPGQ